MNAHYRYLLKKYEKQIELFIPESYKDPLTHDVENALAAYAICSKFGVSKKVFDQALSSFQKPPHRIEFVRTLRGVSFYNDSKGTNLDAVVRAVESMSGKVILIAGGRDKGGSFTYWIEPFRHKVKSIVAIGEARGKIERELAAHYRVTPVDTFEAAVITASDLAEEGENVLLSPGCSSFDMFGNFEERGDVFKEIVRRLKRG